MKNVINMDITKNILYGQLTLVENISNEVVEYMSRKKEELNCGSLLFKMEQTDVITKIALYKSVITNIALSDLFFATEPYVVPVKAFYQALLPLEEYFQHLHKILTENEKKWFVTWRSFSWSSYVEAFQVKEHMFSQRGDLLLKVLAINFPVMNRKTDNESAMPYDDKPIVSHYIMEQQRRKEEQQLMQEEPTVLFERHNNM